jgi:hypothetical protein
MEESISVLLGFHTFTQQPKEQAGDKNGINSLTLKKGGCAGLGKDRE